MEPECVFLLGPSKAWAPHTQGGTYREGQCGEQEGCASGHAPVNTKCCAESSLSMGPIAELVGHVAFCWHCTCLPQLSFLLGAGSVGVAQPPASLCPVQGRGGPPQAVSGSELLCGVALLPWPWGTRGAGKFWPCTWSAQAEGRGAGHHPDTLSWTHTHLLQPMGGAEGEAPAPEA